ncbi:MAG: type II toxin-antitoxin system RelE/ParE family toxin [Pseudomonadota bacterium]
MQIFKNRWFNKWAKKEKLADSTLRAAVAEMEDGLIDADLGGHVVKKRIPLPGRGKRGGARSIIAYRIEEKAFFIYGFAKNKQANLSATELEALQILAADLLGYDSATLKKLVEQKKLIEVNNDE